MIINNTTIYTFSSVKDNHLLNSATQSIFYRIKNIHDENSLINLFSQPKLNSNILIFLSNLSSHDFNLIKQIKGNDFNIEIILLSTKKSINGYCEFSKLGIFSTHNHSVSPALLNLDIERIIKKNSYLKTQTINDILVEKNKTILDLDLFILYKKRYLNNLHHKTEISHKKDKHTMEHLFLEEIVNKTKVIDSSFHTSLIAPKVLVVEDDISLNKRLCSWLKQNKYICHSSHTALSALDKLNSSKFDLILLDIGLPDRSGDEIIQKIKEINSKSCIIILSGYKDAELITHCLQVGAQDFITKPFIPSELLDVIDKNLKFSIVRSLPDSIFNSLFKNNYKKQTTKTNTPNLN